MQWQMMDLELLETYPYSDASTLKQLEFILAETISLWLEAGNDWPVWDGVTPFEASLGYEIKDL